LQYVNSPNCAPPFPRAQASKFFLKQTVARAGGIQYDGTN
jgi:hypothetical protein